MNSPWMTQTQVAEYLHVRPRTIQAWINEKAFPVHYLGSNTPRYHREEVDQWVLERGKETSNG